MFNVQNQGYPQGTASAYNQQQGYVQSGYIPQLPCLSQMGPNEQPVAVMIVGNLIDLIQGTANQNPLRQFVFNELSSNAFCNQSFDSLVQEVVDAVSGAMYQTRGKFEEVCPEVVNDYMTCYYGDTLLSRAPQLQSSMPPNAVQAAQQLNPVMQRINQYINTARQYRQQQMQGQPYGNNMPPPQQPYNGGMYQQPPGNQQMMYGGGQPQGNMNQYMAGGGTNFNQHFATPTPPTPTRNVRVSAIESDHMTLDEIYANRARKEAEKNRQSAPPPQAHEPQPEQGRPQYQAPQPTQPEQGHPQYQAPQQTPQDDWVQMPSPGDTGVTRTTRRSPIMEVFDEDGYRDYRTEQEKTNDAIAQARRQASPPKAVTASKPFVEREDIYDDEPFKENFVKPGRTTTTPEPQQRTIQCLDGTMLTLEGTKETRPNDYVKLRDAKSGKLYEMMPAHLAPWKPNDPFNPIPEPCDPNLEILFYRRWEDGLVDRVILLMDSSMDYMRHEPNLVNRQKGGRDKHHVPLEADWRKLEGIKHPPVSDDDGAVDYEDIKDNQTPFIVPEVFTASNLREAEFERDLYFLDKGLNKNQQNDLHEFSFIQTTPFMDLNDDVAGETYSDVLAELGKVNTVDEYHEKLGEVDSDDRLSDRIWHYLNDEATATINDALATSMPDSVSDWRIDDFFVDWPHLLEAFIDNLSDDVGRELFKHLERFVRPRVILAGGTVLTGDSFDEWCEYYPGPVANSPQMFKENATVLVRQCSVTQVAWSLKDLDNIFAIGDVVSVQASHRPRTYAGIKAIMERNRKTKDLPYHRHYIRTADNATIEIHRGVFNKHHYVVRLINL